MKIRYNDEITVTIDSRDTKAVKAVKALINACDAEGMLQAHQMRRLVDNPRFHSAMKIESALALFGTVENAAL